MLFRSARLLVASALVVGTALVSPGVAPANAARPPRAQQSGACASADLTPTADNLDAIGDAILCLHNRDRATRGLPALRENARLRRAAAGHTGDMIRRRYFAHESPGGGDMVGRILSADYVRSAEGWTLGENLAWGADGRATPAAIEKAWMASPEHRANILRRSFREVGIGVALGTPLASPGATGATYTADFGVRR